MTRVHQLLLAFALPLLAGGRAWGYVAGGIGAGSVGPTQLATGAVQTAKGATDHVTTPKIINGAVQTSKLDTDAVTSGKIINGAVETSKVAPDAIDTLKVRYTAHRFQSASFNMGGTLSAGSAIAARGCLNVDFDSNPSACTGTTSASFMDGFVTTNYAFQCSQGGCDFRSAGTANAILNAAGTGVVALQTASVERARISASSYSFTGAGILGTESQALAVSSGCSVMVPAMSVDGAVVSSGSIVSLRFRGDGLAGTLVFTTTTTATLANPLGVLTQSGCPTNTVCSVCVKGLAPVRCASGLTAGNAAVTSTTRGVASQSASPLSANTIGFYMETQASGSDGWCTLMLGMGF